jgi:TolA-binding protein
MWLDSCSITGSAAKKEGRLHKSSMTSLKSKFARPALVVMIACLISCAYFNTVYNAKDYFRQGMKLVKHDTLTIDSDNFDKAIEKSTAIIVKYPDTRWVDDALFMMGASYYYKGDFARSVEKLDFLTLNYPESGFYAEAQYLVGLANYKLKKYGSAIIALEEAKQSRKYRKKAMIALLYVYFADGSYDRMYAVADTLLKGSLKYDEQRAVLRFVSMAQFNEERYEEALETYKRLLELTREETARRELKLRIAEIYMEIGEYKLCRDFVEDEIEPEFRGLLGDLCMATGDAERAKEIYLELSQGSEPRMAAEAYYKIAQMYEQEDSIQLAAVYYDSALTRAPNSEYGLEARKKSEVLKRIQSLTSETADSVRAQFLLAEIYYADLGEIDKAVAGYKKVYSEYPDSKWAPKALYAHLWIAKNVLEDDTLAARLARDLVADYPRTEYAMSARNFVEPAESGAENDE